MILLIYVWLVTSYYRIVVKMVVTTMVKCGDTLA
jgi:hypothetical protein